MQILTSQGAALKYAITQATKWDKRKRLTFNARLLPVSVDITVPSNSRPVKCSTYKSTIYRGCGDRLPLSIRQVLGTSRNLYIESISLLRATINLHMGVVARSTASWMQQAWLFRCSFSFNPFYYYKQWWWPREVVWPLMSRPWV